MVKFFNTAGPNKPDQHYMLPPLERWDLAEILTLIDRERHFLLHAPRQMGKTSCLLALIESLNRAGRYRAPHYTDKRAATEGHLILFDRRPERSWADKIFQCQERDPAGRVIGVWGA